MSGRRSNNISAAQIRDDFLRRQQSAQQQNPPTAEEDEEDAQPEVRPAEKSKKRKRSNEKGKAKLKVNKKSKKRGSSDDEDEAYEDGDFINNMYKKSKPHPGQLENCEICNKRFTVTPYSKTGPEGGLVCTPCGKELKAEEKAAEKSAKKPVPRKKRRAAESNRLDGIVSHGTKTLQQLCIEKVADHHLDIEEFGDLPDLVLERLSEIFSKRRVLNPRTLALFLRPDLDTVVINDCAYLEVDDYKQIFAVVPNVTKLVLRNACQFKDSVLVYMMEKATQITHFQVYASNLVSNEMWKRFFEHYGHKLETLKLEWLDAAFDDEVVETMVKHCSQLRRLKFKFCRKITTGSLPVLCRLQSLEHLSLQLSQSAESSQLVPLISQLGPRLETLSLENCADADDSVIDEIRTQCGQLSKLRLSEVDCITDAALKSMFETTDTPSCLPPLTFVDLSSARDVDNNNPSGPEDAPIGLASESFTALMAHSGSRLECLHIASCRHISHAAFCDVFDGSTTYPMIREINLSFCNAVDTAVIMGIFKCCPQLKKLIAFGCFKVEDVVVPSGIALIGVPRAHDAIEQFGDGGIDLGAALSMMGSAVAVGA